MILAELEFVFLIKSAQVWIWASLSSAWEKAVNERVNKNTIE